MRVSTADSFGRQGPRRLYESYLACLERLHGPDVRERALEISFPSRFRYLFRCSDEVIGFVLDGEGRVCSTAQASRARTFPVEHVYVNNVVTLEQFGERGLGRMVMEGLVGACCDRWGTPLKFVLTNSPKKNNAQFYEALGWTARGHDSDNPTVAWELNISS